LAINACFSGIFPERQSLIEYQYLLEEKNEQKVLAFNQYFNDLRHDPGGLRPRGYARPDHGSGSRAYQGTCGRADYGPSCTGSQ
jgi:hypothetical protein